MPLLSICIPTCKRPDVVKETILSIYSQNVDHSLFNVCITDNSESDETEKMIENEIPAFDNLFYKRVVCEGFMNSIEALKYGNGEFLKLHNDYSKFNKDSLSKMINTIKSLDRDSLIFFGMGLREIPEGFTKYTSFNDFMYNINYWSTWSSGFAVWKNDFELVMQKGIVLDRMFPHTSVMFNLVQKKYYYIDNTEYVENLPLKKKGGYNLVDNFVSLYMGMVKDLLDKKNISIKTYELIKSSILQFVADWYVSVKIFNDKYSFTFDDWECKVRSLYGQNGVDFIKKNYRKKFLKAYCRKILKRY